MANLAWNRACKVKVNEPKFTHELGTHVIKQSIHNSLAL